MVTKALSKNYFSKPLIIWFATTVMVCLGNRVLGISNFNMGTLTGIPDHAILLGLIGNVHTAQQQRYNYKNPLSGVEHKSNPAQSLQRLPFTIILVFGGL